MRWGKLGRVYVPDGSKPWAQDYACPPTPHQLDADLLRLYIAFCDPDTIGRVGYVDVRADDPMEVVRVSQKPVLDIGEPGAFDENGVLPTCVVPVGDRLYLYYVGYQLGVKVKYFQFQGLAVSSDGGESFQRAQRVPVLERSDTELLNRHRPSSCMTMTASESGTWEAASGRPSARNRFRSTTCAISSRLTASTGGPRGVSASTSKTTMNTPSAVHG